VVKEVLKFKFSYECDN